MESGLHGDEHKADARPEGVIEAQGTSAPQENQEIFAIPIASSQSLSLSVRTNHPCADVKSDRLLERQRRNSEVALGADNKPNGTVQRTPPAVCRKCVGGYPAVIQYSNRS